VALAAIKLQCEHLIGFTEFRFPRYRPAVHHRFIAEQLERVERGEIDRLMLFDATHARQERACLEVHACVVDRPQAVASVHQRQRVRRSCEGLGPRSPQHRDERSLPVRLLDAVAGGQQG
jgi:hypothetical protein